jgi:hypothetical protein
MTRSRIRHAVRNLRTETRYALADNARGRVGVAVACCARDLGEHRVGNNCRRGGRRGRSRQFTTDERGDRDLRYHASVSELRQLDAGLRDDHPAHPG